MTAFRDYLKFIRRNSLFQVIYHVTRKCNSRCVSCFSWQRTEVNTPELSIEEIRRISATMPEFPWLLLSGGEPFLREDLPEIISVLFQNNNVRHITLPTNALLPERIHSMTQKICASADNATLNLVLSIDGIGPEHDRLRGCPGSFDALIKTWQLVGPLRAETPNLSVKFHTVLSNLNYTRFDEIKRFVEKLEPDLHTFDFLRGTPADASLTLPPEEALTELADKIKAVLRQYGGYERLRKHHSLLKTVYEAVVEDYYDQFLKIRREKRQTIPCVADRMTLVLGASGEVSLCEMLPSFASFRDFGYDFDSLWNSEASIKARSGVSAGKCYCYHPCYQTVNVLFRPTSVLRALAKRAITR
ncbi:MAG: radical SAM protein [Candidatus Lindowbacteria bacterium]|nr:radical SAM protein [Candidatus Lindowbacteria bacterium]